MHAGAQKVAMHTPWSSLGATLAWVFRPSAMLESIQS